MGVVSRKDFREIPPKVEYSLTERGVELANVLRPLCEWGAENFGQQIAPPQLDSYAPPRKLVTLTNAVNYYSGDCKIQATSGGDAQSKIRGLC
jgi:HxlR-like helix-turn-helix